MPTREHDRESDSGITQAGVFIHDFNCGWLHHPFLQNQVKMKTDKNIEKIVKHRIRDVYIDTDRGLDVEDAPTQEELLNDLLLLLRC